MKVYIKKTLSLLLVMGLVASVAPVYTPTADAATKKVTLLKGESTSITVYGSAIKSVKSSKSSVIKAKKASSYKVTIKAKKKGTSTVTIKAKNGKQLKYKFKVNKVKLPVKVVDIDVVNTGYSTKTYVTFKITNKTGVCLQNADINYVLTDAAGTVLKSGAERAYIIPNKKTAYRTVYYNGEVAAAAGTGSLTSTSRTLNYKYTDITKKITIKEYSNNNNTIQFTVKNKSSQYSTGYADIVFYDANGKIRDVEQLSLYLNKKTTETKTVYGPSDAVSYKILNKRAYYSKFQSV